MWFIFALACMLFWGAADLFYKKGNDAGEPSTHLRTAVTVGVAFGLYATYLLVVKGVPFDPANFLIYLPVSLCYILSMIVGYFGLRYLAVSVSSPIQNSSGAVAAVLCMVLLGQLPDALSAVGIVAICAGIFYLGVLERRESAAEIAAADKKYVSSFRALLFPIVYCVIDALGTFLDAYYLDDVDATPLRGVTEETLEDVANIAYLYTFLLVGVVCLIILLVRREKLILPGTRSRAAAACFETAGQAVYVYAMSGNGVVAAPMVAAYCMVSLLLGRLFLKEKLTVKKYAAIGLAVLGIILMGIAEGISGAAEAELPDPVQVDASTPSISTPADPSASGQAGPSAPAQSAPSAPASSAQTGPAAPADPSRPADPSAPAVPAQGGVTVTAAPASGPITAGGTVDVVLTLEGNTGLAGGLLTVTYDRALTLTGVRNGTALKGLDFTPSGDLSADPVNLLWTGTDAVDTNGPLATLTFAVPAGTAGGAYEIALSCEPDGFFDNDLNDVAMTLSGCSVTVAAGAAA